jgi:hypothetical protein
MGRRIISLGPGMWMHPDDGDRNTPYHRRILRVESIQGAPPIARVLVLDCRHTVGYIADPAHLEGRVPVALPGKPQLK